MAAAVAAGVQASLVTAHRSGEAVSSTWSGLSRGVWRIKSSSKQKALLLMARRVTRCEGSSGGSQAGRTAEEAGRAAGQVLDGVKHKVVDFQETADVQGKTQRANLKLDDLKEEIARRIGRREDEPLLQFVRRKGRRIRWEVVGYAETACNGVVAIYQKPVVKRSLFGFLLFYAFSVVWAARIMFFDKKSEEAREQFGRELRLQKLQEAGAAEAGATSSVSAPVEVKVNGRKTPSGNDEEFRLKVRKIQEMAREVRASENKAFAPSESGFVSISGNGAVAEPEKQQPELLKRRKQRKTGSEDKLGLGKSAPAEKRIDGVAVKKPPREPERPVKPIVAQAEKRIDGVAGKKLSREPERPVKPIVAQAETPSVNAAKDTVNVGVKDTLRSKVVDENSKSAQVPLRGDINGSGKSTLNGSKTPSDEKPTSSASGEVKLPSNGDATSNVNGAARPVPPVRGSMRVITSPEEARARIAARKARDGNASAKGSSARPKFPRITMPPVEESESDLDKDKDGLGGADDQGSKAESKSSSSSQEEKEAKSAEQQEEEAWMRDEVLRSVVLKVRDNEEAGRDSFHGLDSEEEQQFFKGLERKFEREGEAVKTWIQDRVENLDYGLGGVGVDDPPETVFPKWKDPESRQAKRFEKFQQDRQKILERHMGISKPSQTDPSTSSSSTPPSTPSPRKSSSSTPPPTPSPRKEESSERLQSNANASGSKTVVTSSGKQAQPAPREWQNTKKWAQELQQKYDMETDPQQRSLIEEVGQDLDRWITEDEIEEAQRLLSQGLAGEEEYVKRHYEKTREKIKQQHDMFGSQGMLNKYGEYKETKEEPELWWLDLPFVCCIGLVKTLEDGETDQGLYSLDMTPEDIEEEGRSYNHTVAFQDPKDAANFCGLLISEQYNADVIPIAPKELYADAKEEGFKVTVLKKGELGLVPGQALDDVEHRLTEIGSSVYWKELERMQSVDIDAILDEGLGYGRPPR